jgi:hypothetical protein
LRVGRFPFLASIRQAAASGVFFRGRGGIGGLGCQRGAGVVRNFPGGGGLKTTRSLGRHVLPFTTLPPPLVASAVLQ